MDSQFGNSDDYVGSDASSNNPNDLNDNTDTGSTDDSSNTTSSPQPQTKRGLDLKNLIEGDLLELLGLGNIADDKKEEIISKMMESLQSRVLVAIVDKLGKDKETEFFNLLDNASDIEVRQYLKDQGIDMNMLVAQEALVYKQTLLNMVKE